MGMRFNVSRVSYLLISHFCFFSLAYSNPRLGHEDKYDTMVVVTATLAALLFIALIALAVVLFLWRKTRQSNGNLIVQLNTVSLIVANIKLQFRLFPFVSCVFERNQSPWRLICSNDTINRLRICSLEIIS